MLAWEWFSEPNILSVFMYLLLSANHKAGKWRGIDVSCGQHITSTDAIATHTGLTRQKVRTALDKLKASGEITIHTTNRYSLVTVVKWAFFQHGTDDGNQQDNTHSNHEVTNNQPAQQPSNNHKQEVKELKNARMEESSAPPLAVGDESTELDSICNRYVFNAELDQAVNDWITYKREKRQPYTPSSLNRLLSQVQSQSDKYGDTAVIHAIHESMASNYQGIVWDKAKTAASENKAPHKGNPFFEHALQANAQEVMHHDIK